jgi:Domain of unknown function (DUF4149)
MLGRLAALLASLWLGLVLTLAAVVAPAAFTVLERSLAGRLAGQCFRIEAQLSLGLALLLLLLHRRLASERGTAVLSTEILLVLGALFCTVLGYFALQPAMEAARAGQGTWSFGALHGASSALFALKGILLLVLVWRGTGQRTSA